MGYPSSTCQTQTTIPLRNEWVKSATSIESVQNFLSVLPGLQSHLESHEQHTSLLLFSWISSQPFLKDLLARAAVTLPILNAFQLKMLPSSRFSFFPGRLFDLEWPQAHLSSAPHPLSLLCPLPPQPSLEDLTTWSMQFMIVS